MFRRTLMVILVFAVVVTPIWHANLVNAQLVEQGLVSYWSFDEDTIDGDILKDVLGNNNGDIFGNPELVAGKVKGAMEFDGSDDHISIPDSDSLNMGESDFSICVWVATEVDAIPSFTTTVFADGDMMGGGDPSYGADIQAGGRPAFELYDLTTWLSSQAKISPTSVNDGDFYHLTWVFERKDNCSIYINGKLDVEHDISMIGDLDNTRGSMIGNTPTRDFFFLGVMDELVVYDRALSEAEVVTNFGAAGLSVDSGDKLASTWGKIKASSWGE